MDTHQYLLPTSCHPKHCGKNIPYSLALRLRCICSDSNTFELRAKELTNQLTPHIIAEDGWFCIRRKNTRNNEIILEEKTISAMQQRQLASTKRQKTSFKTLLFLLFCLESFVIPSFVWRHFIFSPGVFSFFCLTWRILFFFAPK